jgi:hypothetical protein
MAVLLRLAWGQLDIKLLVMLAGKDSDQLGGWWGI